MSVAQALPVSPWLPLRQPPSQRVSASEKDSSALADASALGGVGTLSLPIKPGHGEY